MIKKRFIWALYHLIQFVSLSSNLRYIMYHVKSKITISFFLLVTSLAELKDVDKSANREGIS